MSERLVITGALLATNARARGDVIACRACGKEIVYSGRKSSSAAIEQAVCATCVRGAKGAGASRAP